jgi:glucokinase
MGLTARPRFLPFANAEYGHERNHVRRIVVADIGGTHARFALAQIEAGRVISLDEPVKLQTSEHASFETAWEEFGRRKGIDLPTELAVAFAGPVGAEVLKLTNNPWVIHPSLMNERLGVDRFIIINDFGAVGHAVATLPNEHFRRICGPDRPLPGEGVISIVGPGTGLGVAMLLRKADGYEVIETEGGHVDFAPLDTLEDRILAELRRNFRRVSVERIASGRGLWNLYEALGAIEGRALTFRDEKELWAAATAGSDSLANAALDRLCLTLGSVAADMALAHGAVGVVIAGGVGLRLADQLAGSGFRDRFLAKGRFERRMDEMPVVLITYPEPGLYGAAAAFAREHP